MSIEEATHLLRQGIAAAKRGQKEQARQLLMQAVELDERNETAWLWLSGVMDDVGDQFVCLENVLTINPNNSAAERGLQHLRARRPEPQQEAFTEAAAGYQEPAADWAAAVEHTATPQEEAAPAEPSKEAEDVGGFSPAGAGAKTCVHCGTVNPGWRDLCSLCGKAVDGGAEVAKMVKAEPGPPSLELESEEIQFVEEYDTRPQGLLTLGAAWIAAVVFNKRGAYEYEIFSASPRRTVTGIVIGGIAVPFLIILLVGLLLAIASAGDTLSLLTSMALTPTMLVCTGLPAAIGLVFQFYLWAAGLYLIAWLLGGKASFVVHAQLLSVAYSATSLLNSFLLIIGGALFVALVELAPQGVELLSGMAGVAAVALLTVIAGIYSLSIHGQAVSVAHRFSWLGGVGVVILSSLLYGLLVVLLLLLFALLTGSTRPDLPSLPSIFPTP